MNEKIKEKVRERLKGFAVIDETMLEAIVNMIIKYEETSKQYEKKIKGLEKENEDLKAVVNTFPKKSEWIELKKYKQLKQQLKSCKKKIVEIVDDRIRELKKELKSNEAFKKVRKRIEKREFPKIGDSLVMIAESQIHAQIEELQQLKKRIISKDIGEIRWMKTY